MFASFTLLFTVFTALVAAAPALDSEILEFLERRLAVPGAVNPGPHAKKALPQQVSTLAPFALLAGAAYCKPAEVKSWSCNGKLGQKYCTNPLVKGVQILLADGDGSHVQYYYVGYWPAKKAVIVGHQGTDPLKLPSVLTDMDFLKEPLNPKYFPGAPKGAMAHRGFANQHAIGADKIIKAVEKLVKDHKAQDIITVGHSLGGALATLSALMIRLHFDRTRSSLVHVSSVTFGTPRVGNKEFAHFYNTKVTNSWRINHGTDIVPVIPPRSLGFWHTRGEVHFINPTEAWTCPGDDAGDDPHCTVETKRPKIDLTLKIPRDHLGPYMSGIQIGSMFC